MKKTILITVVAIMLMVFPSYSQVKQLIHKASVATDRMDYDEAISLYNQALALEPNSYRANLGKGMVLAEFMERYDQAIPFLEKALSVSSKDTLIRLDNTLGKSYEYVGDYPRAMYYYKRVNSYGAAGNPDYDAYLTLRIASCKYGMEHTTIAPVSEQWIKNLGTPINSNMPEYGAVVMGNDFIFTSKRKDTPDEKKNGLDGRYFESMYKSTMVDGKYTEPVRYTVPDLQGNSTFQKHNEAVISASADGKILYVFRDGKIFEANMDTPTDDANKMGRNINIAKYQNHACLTPDGNELYFVSETSKGGGTDIYMAQKGSDGKWNVPERLDMTVNTNFDEDAPYMGSDGTLFFSSNGLPGYGGFDVYKTHKQNGHWTTPENLGRPINSSGDDIFFALDNNSTEGYYSSARPGGQGDIDIYRVHYAPAKLAVTVPLPLVVIAVPKDTIIETIVSVQQPIKADWNLTAVYFDFDKYILKKAGKEILDYNITQLNLNPEYTFIISGYADSRGTDDYNNKLSSKRAEYVKNYMIQHGISKTRIASTNFYGESRLSNNCSDGVICTEDEHQVNRRVDLSIVERKKVNRPYLGVTK